MSVKPRLAIYWGASCGGCEISVINLHERLLDVDAAFDLVFCPCLMDAKKSDVVAMADESITLTLFNGAIRTAENVEMAQLLRQKSQTLVAFGMCAVQGGIPGLANLSEAGALERTVFLKGPTIDNPAGTVPQPATVVPEGVLELPQLLPRVKCLSEIVGVDYVMPGCPPEAEQIWSVLDVVIRGLPLPPKGSVLGAGRSSVCRECSRQRTGKTITTLRRTWQGIPDPDICLMEQGIVCMGLVTRDGCGGLCPRVQMPCIGCYGPPEGVEDQGAKMAGALGSMLDIKPLKRLSEAEIAAQIDAVLDAVPDYAGTFYKFSVPGSLLKGVAPAQPETGTVTCNRPDFVLTNPDTPNPPPSGER